MNIQTNTHRQTHNLHRCVCTGLMADKLSITALADRRFEEFRKEAILFLPAQTHTHTYYIYTWRLRVMRHSPAEPYFHKQKANLNFIEFFLNYCS